MNRSRIATSAAMATLALLLGAGCGGGGGESTQPAVTATSPTRSTATTAEDEAAPDESTETTATEDGSSSDETTTTLAAGAVPGLDDYDGDGENEPTCGTQDYGAGLVLRTLCTPPGNPNTPSEGVTLVPGSLFAFPASASGTDVVKDVSASAVEGRDAAGNLVVVFFINSDTLFAVGNSDLGDAAVATLGGLAVAIQGAWPTGAVEVRGHTDATGSAADNQALSERRAATVVSFLGRSGIDAGRLSGSGLGSTVPIARETNDAGGVDEPGQRENRRVEIVVRVP